LVENEPTLTGETVVTVPYMTLAFTRRKSGFDAFIVDRSIAVLKEKSLFPDNSAVCSRENRTTVASHAWLDSNLT